MTLNRVTIEQHCTTDYINTKIPGAIDSVKQDPCRKAFIEAGKANLVYLVKKDCFGNELKRGFVCLIDTEAYLAAYAESL
jgi:hypothetical protein